MNHEEDIKHIIDDYYLLNRRKINVINNKYAAFREVYNDFVNKTNEVQSKPNEKGFFYFVNTLNKMARKGERYCGVDMTDFAAKFRKLHPYKSAFDVNLFDKDSKGRFVIKQLNENYVGVGDSQITTGNDIVGNYELIPIEKDLYSIFKALIYKYFDLILFPNEERINLKDNLETNEKIYSWDNIIFKNSYIFVKNTIDGTLLCTYVVPQSKPSFKSLKPLFKKNFPNLEIRIRDNKPIFNDEKRFNEVLMSVNTDNSDDEIPDLVATPKPTVLRYFDSLSNERMKEYVINLKQKFFSYLCQKQLDKYKIRYALEKRINVDSEADEDAFIFTISESSDKIVAVYENVLDQRSSIAFIIDPKQYENAINSIAGYFSSDKINKREFLSNHYVTFKDSGIMKVKRIIHNDYSQWTRYIDYLPYSWI